MSAQEQIDVFLHSEPCVTSSWLANLLCISARAAVEALSAYKSKAGAEVHAKHLVTRRDAQGNYSLTVIDEEHLDSLLKDKTQSVLSCAIYSLEKTHSAATPAQMVSSAFELVEALLSSSSSSSAEGFLSNSAGEISLRGLTVKPIGERLLSRCNTSASVNNTTANNNNTAAAAAPSSIASLAKDPPKVVSVEKAASFFRKTATASNTNTTTKTKTTSSAEANNAPSGTTTAVTEEALIGSQASTQSESKYEPLQTKKSADSKAKRTKPSKKSTKDEEDEEWDDGEPVVAKKKRGIAEEKNGTDEEKEEDDGAEAAEESKPAKKSKAAKPVNVNVRGAMDDYMEDAAIEQAKTKAEQPQVEEGKKKKTKKVLVEKTFTDEKGYFVTETVWEEVTDNEADNVSAVKPQPKAAAVEDKKEEKKATATAGKGKKADGKPSGGVQKSMMSFFAKKT